MFAEFFLENWMLFLALSAVMLLLMFDPGSAGGGSGARGVSPMELSRLVNHEQAVMVDIRKPEEYASGHIPKSRNIPLDELESNAKKLEKFKKRPMVLICQSGNRAGKAAKTLRKLEFDKLYLLSGGLIEWQKDNLPLEKSAEKGKKAGGSKSKATKNQGKS